MTSVDLKLVLLGHKNVGKTSIFNRYVYDEFGKTSMTIGAYFGMKTLTISNLNNNTGATNIKSASYSANSLNNPPNTTPTPENPTTTVNLAIWDTAGEEKFDSLTNFYCRNALAALIVYDITASDTYSNLQRWISKIHNEADKDCSILLVGNKLDLAENDQRRVELAQAKAFANSLGSNITVVETSAKSGENISLIFEAVVKQSLIKQQQSAARRANNNNNNPHRDTVTMNTPDTNKESGGCC